MQVSPHRTGPGWRRALPALCVALLLALTGPAAAQDHGAGGKLLVEDVRQEVLRRYADMDPAALAEHLRGSTPEAEADAAVQRVRQLWNQVVCACPRENWSKTLLNCPDGCADPQKQDIMRAVLAGRTDAEILDQQVEQHGPRARAAPEGPLTYVLPFVALLLGAGLVAFALVKLRRGAAPHVSGPAARPDAARRTAPRTSDSESEELLAVERELREIV